ncbi:glycosyltransferase [Cognatishimia sp. F0-27]|uniref:glycosyltransferase n=1 Tax=Cognatishimia sp. F0-27 TaxID=2816855 RepID=UPI001D0C21F8|nr:glycosyltransferase [Cognatishimia sp. F0-27]MCC1493604.1 glycosyltransferase [Cognatishimia sp. F0-27]
MKAAIATSDYHVPGETFINRHIAHLFGGNTCVICGRANGDDPYQKPLFERRAKLSARDTLLRPFAALSGAVLHGTSRLPFGDNRAALAAFLRAQRVDVILSEFGTQALVVAKLGNDLGIPVFTYWRGTDASRALRSAQRVRSYRKMMPRLAGMISVSQFLLDNLARHGVRHPNAHVIPSGVDTSRFQPGDKRPLSCLAVGRMVEKKAPLVTLDAFATAARGTAAHLTFIGDGPLLEPARARAADLGVADQVTFTGALPHDAVRAHLAQTAFFLQHSVTAKDGNTEGLPTAIQEALACGAIPISTVHAGIPEAVIPGKNGFLVEEWDQDGFAAAIAEAFALPDPDRLARAARATALERFDNGVLLEKLERVIRDTIAGPSV